MGLISFLTSTHPLRGRMGLFQGANPLCFLVFFSELLSLYDYHMQHIAEHREEAMGFAVVSHNRCVNRKSGKTLRWLGTVVTSHTASNRQAYTPVMSMLQKAVQSTHCTSCNQPAHTNAIMLYAVKCSLYVVGPFLYRILHKSWSTGVKMWQNCSVFQNEHGDIWIFFANPFL